MKPLTEMGNYVYTYTCPITNKIFYVGEGKGYRAWAHLKPSSIMPYDVNYPSHWGYIKKLYLLAQEPIIEIVFEGTKRECLAKERELIDYYGDQLLQTKTMEGVSKTWSQQAKVRYKALCKENRKYDIKEDELRQMYVIMGMTRKQLAAHYGCSEILIKQRLKEYSIRKK